MATWIIGDIHGCWRTLERLLERIGWNPIVDELWLVGDLVNRGPESLQVLRWAYRNRRHLTAVLGNHDLHLLARSAAVGRLRPEDRFDEVMAAEDRPELIDWLRRRPLVHRRDKVLMVHAGLWPAWSADEAAELGGDVSRRLGGVDWQDFLASVVGKPRSVWRPGLSGDQQSAAAATVLTRLRVVRPDGRPKLGYTGPPESAPDGCRPWFEASQAVRSGYTVIFGHWAMLGLHREGEVICLDSGCVYGGSLSALHLEEGIVVQEPVADPVPPWEE